MNDMTETPADISSDEPVDGRTMRRNRNRTAVISALLDMIREGDLHPGAAEIAERAGVSHRSIFRYFDDLDDLVRTTIDQAFQDAGPLSTIPESGSGSLEHRVASLVDARLKLFAHVDGAMRLARMRAYSIPSIDGQIAVIAKEFRRQIGEHFDDELNDTVDPESVVDAVLVLTSYDAFSIHTRLLSRTPKEVRTAWVHALTALLET